MHLGLARAKLRPAAMDTAASLGSPTDALVNSKSGAGCAAASQSGSTWLPSPGLRIEFIPTVAAHVLTRCGWLGICPDVVQDVPDFGAVRDKGDDAHLPAADRAQKRKHLVDARNQHRPEVVRWPFGWWGGSGLGVVLDAVAPAWPCCAGLCEQLPVVAGSAGTAATCAGLAPSPSPHPVAV